MSAAENPPAYPQFGMAFGDDPYLRGGMTLRDWFAGQALAGWNASGGTDGEAYHHTAETAYRQADAMLVERARTQEYAK